MNTESTAPQGILHGLIQSAREQLLVIQTYSPECSPGSPAQLAFDPYISRRLQMFTPIRVIFPPDFEKTCNAIRSFLDGFDELNLLKDKNELVTWEVSFFQFFFSFSQWAGPHSSIDCGPLASMVTRSSHTSTVLAIFDSGQS